MKTKQVDTQSIVNTQHTYKDIIFGKNMGRMSEQNWRSRSDSRVYVLIKAKEMTREGHKSHIGQYSWGRKGAYWWKDWRGCSSGVDNKCRKTFRKFLWALILWKLS